jgi:hypothetical protein
MLTPLADKPESKLTAAGFLPPSLISFCVGSVF